MVDVSVKVLKFNNKNDIIYNVLGIRMVHTLIYLNSNRNTFFFFWDRNCSLFSKNTCYYSIGEYRMTRLWWVLNVLIPFITYHTQYSPTVCVGIKGNEHGHYGNL